VGEDCALLIEQAYWTVAKPDPERTHPMSSSQELYNRVSTKLQTLHPTMHLKRLTVWVWVVVGLIQGQSVQLSEIANHIPGETQAAGRIMRIRRWLASKSIVSRTLYQPLIEQVLEPWAGREVTIMLDGCFIRHKALQILRVSLSHCYRAIPLAWEVVTSNGNVELEVCEAMLEHVAKLIGRLRRVTFLADRGFRSRDWARKCRELDWDYIIGLPTTPSLPSPVAYNALPISWASSRANDATSRMSKSRWRPIGPGIWRSPGPAPQPPARPNSVF
jgi:hypothetical protein